MSGIVASRDVRERSTVAEYDDRKSDGHANEQLDADRNRQRAHFHECKRECEQTRTQSAVTMIIVAPGQLILFSRNLPGAEELRSSI